MFNRFTKLFSMMFALLLATTTASAALAAGPAPQTDQTIVDIAANDGRFTTLVMALQTADLAGTLSSDGPFTVFAPTDDAFAALPEGTVQSLLEDVPALTDILLYHVVPGKVMAADVVNLESANTLQGSPVSISVDGNTVMINDAQVIITDIEASNGVIHVIDAVLLPPSGEEEGEAAEEPQMAEPQAEGEGEGDAQAEGEGEGDAEASDEGMADESAQAETVEEEVYKVDGADSQTALRRRPPIFAPIYRGYYPHRVPYYPRPHYHPRINYRCYSHCGYYGRPIYRPHYPPPIYRGPYGYYR